MAHLAKQQLVPEFLRAPHMAEMEIGATGLLLNLIVCIGLTITLGQQL